MFSAIRIPLRLRQAEIGPLICYCFNLTESASGKRLRPAQRARCMRPQTTQLKKKQFNELTFDFDGDLRVKTGL